jgi:cytochrome P450
VVTRYAQCREIQQDPRTFTHTEPQLVHDEPLMPSFFDPPEQTKQRSVILPLMTAAKIDPLEPRMRQVCRDLVASFKDKGHCDVVAEFARRYPISIFGDLYGLPEERREEFRNLAEVCLHRVEDRLSAWANIRQIMRDELENRLEHPRDDMLNGIAHGQIDGKPIAMDVAVNLASTVFLGGLDTLPSNIGWTLRYLSEHPEQRRQISQHPETIPTAVEEFFRVFPSVAKNAPVRATRDVEFHGVHINKGELVYTMICLANQDSAVFDDPLTLDFTRTSNKHMAFSAGSHRCLGSHLARHELGVARQEWHAAIPEYRVADYSQITYTGGVLAMTYLPLEWDI